MTHRSNKVRSGRLVSPTATLYDTESQAADNPWCTASSRICDSTLTCERQRPRSRILSEPIVITSKLAMEQRPALEQLLFFNVNQHRVRHGIEQSIATYGCPEILESEGSLRIRVGDIEGVQSLFAVGPTGRPLGVAVFVRLAHERFVVLHLGVLPRSGSAPDVNAPVLLRLMHEIRSAARRTRGVDRIELVYKERHPVRLNV